MAIDRKADKRTLDAFIQLAGHPDFQAVTAFLAEQTLAENLSLLNSTGENVFRAQGRVQVLHELHNLITNPSKVLEALQKRAEGLEQRNF